ncbi:hypothetical protein ACFYPT_41495 [Streptomyces sp. NPDC005529]|uniref:hypothetical protein n=1 Tax=unclassified Streptomyces TaxID=2593676 RepID=UPI0033AFE127
MTEPEFDFWTDLESFQEGDQIPDLWTDEFLTIVLELGNVGIDIQAPLYDEGRHYEGIGALGDTLYLANRNLIAKRIWKKINFYSEHYSTGVRLATVTMHGGGTSNADSVLELPFEDFKTLLFRFLYEAEPLLAWIKETVKAGNYWAPELVAPATQGGVRISYYPERDVDTVHLEYWLPINDPAGSEQWAMALHSLKLGSSRTLPPEVTDRQTRDGSGRVRQNRNGRPGGSLPG